tara:strand:+ start:296 stop:514 length:219 start_codon:yes stop_codon:yes gene_type:complete
LISVKQKLRKHKNKSEEGIGRLYFHRCSCEKISISEEAKLSILDSMDVQISDHQDKTYDKAYKKCIEAIRRS